MWRTQSERYAESQTVTLSKLTGTMGAYHGPDRDTHVFPRGIMTAIHRSDILEPSVRPYAGAIGDAFVLMQYYVCAHPAQVSMTFIDDTGIIVMNWPSTKQNIPGAFFLDVLDNDSIIQRMYIPLSMRWFRNCSQNITKGHQEYDTLLSGVCER